MCWVDKNSIKQMLKLRDDYNISQFVETGVFKGVNVRLHSFHWDKVMSCDISDEYIAIAKDYVKDRDNIIIEKKSSADFIKGFIKKYKEEDRSDIVFFFLDAHFYDPNLPTGDKWVITHELESLKGFKNCVICIHDFDCSDLGHCCYDSQPLGFPLVLSGLLKVNPNFYFYVNNRENCEIHDEKSIYEVKELVINEEVLDNIRYANSCDRLRYRGLLYCTPGLIDTDKYDLRRA